MAAGTSVSISSVLASSFAQARSVPRRALAACLVAGACDLAVMDLKVGPALFASANEERPAAVAIVRTSAATATARATVNEQAQEPAAPLPTVLLPAPASTIVYFASDSADLDEAARTQIATLAARFVGADAVVDGHADPRGADPYNRTLSQRRAAAVAQELRARGVAVRTVSAFGATQPAAIGRGAEALRLDRRVVVSFERARRGP
jgi:outer membrane protein OmpA-like peptidoglycan-associated protein